jgi:dienelactone hydrolase
MRRRLAFILLLLLSLPSVDDLKAEPARPQPVLIDTHLIDRMKVPSRPAQLQSQLFMPASGSPPFPVVIIMSSSGGVMDVRESFYARELAKNGIAALVVDSFGSRGVKNVGFDQSQVTLTQMEADAYAANIWLRNDKRFDADHIGVMGVSRGGVVSHYLALDIRRKWTRSEDVKFAAYGAIVPACNIRHQNLKTDGKPLFFMIAGLDDTIPPAHCTEYAKQLSAAGNKNVRVKIYPKAHHAWEALGRVGYSPNAEQFTRCPVTIDDQGRFHVDGRSKSMTGQEWVSYAKSTCVFRGRHYGGGTKQLKDEATKDIIDFFKASGFIPP